MMGLEATALQYSDALVDTDRGRALRVISEVVAAGASPEDVVFSVVLPSMERLLSRSSESGATCLAQHFLASQISSDVVEEMLPRFRRRPSSPGSVVIGSALGDFHGLGKRIVVGCLKARMFQVVDLGLNVPAQRFVDEAVRLGAQVIGVSSLMVHTATGIRGPRAVRELLDERGLHGRVKLIVGGAPYLFDEQLYRTVGADAWGRNGLVAADEIATLVSATKGVSA
jgi:methanogenic corrinoid protein MtbC1